MQKQQHTATRSRTFIHYNSTPPARYGASSHTTTAITTATTAKNGKALAISNTGKRNDAWTTYILHL